MTIKTMMIKIKNQGRWIRELKTSWASWLKWMKVKKIWFSKDQGVILSQISNISIWIQLVEIKNQFQNIWRKVHMFSNKREISKLKFKNMLFLEGSWRERLNNWKMEKLKKNQERRILNMMILNKKNLLRNKVLIIKDHS